MDPSATSIMRVGLGLGSNLGDRLANLQRARARILLLPVITAAVVSAPLFETEPVDCPGDAGAFLNTVVEVGLSADADLLSLLASLREIEHSLGRPSRYPRNVSRLIDLDILYAGEHRLHAPELTLPHPRLAERRFVLAPLAAIHPDLVLPGETRTVAEILRELPDAATVRSVQHSW